MKPLVRISTLSRGDAFRTTITRRRGVVLGLWRTSVEVAFADRAGTQMVSRHMLVERVE